MPSFLRVNRAFECLLLFAALPVTLSFLRLDRALLLALWVVTLICLRFLQRDAAFPNTQLWNRKAVTRRNFTPIFMRFLCCAALLATFTWATEPASLFSFPKRNPVFWMMVMVLYPVLSAYPQEVIYRAFFFRRYRGLFTSNAALVAASAASFGMMHIVFRNPVAVMFSTLGGAMFALTYLRHRSLLLATIEHALYGCFIFTIGLGHYFYTGAIR